MISKLAHAVRANRRPTLVGRLFLGINVTLLAVFGASLLWEYHYDWWTVLAEKRSDLRDEARVLLPAILLLKDHRSAAMQSLLDEACKSTRETTSPGHHIAVCTASGSVQARVHHLDSPEMLEAMAHGAETPDGVASLGNEFIVVGSARKGDVRVYVSEYLSTIKRAVRGPVVIGVLTILVAGVVLGVVLNVVLHRSMGTHLQGMVGVVQRFGQGDFGARMPGIDTQELAALAEEFDRMASALQEAEAERRHWMERARKIQQNLLPDLSSIRGMRVCSVFEPAAHVAGDFYDVIPAADGSRLFCIADVSGHGVPAAITAAMLKILAQSALKTEKEPARVLGYINDAYRRVSLPDEFATMLLVYFNAGTNTITWANAGHEPGFLFERDGEMQALPPTGPILGVFGSAQWEQGTSPVRPGSRLLMLTDGLADALSPAGELLGRDRLLSLLKEGRSLPFENLPGLVVERIAAYRGSAPQTDDMTLLALEF